MRSIQYIPRATEKAYNAEAQNKYIFYVPKGASKQEIAKQISAGFKVTVIDVKTYIRKGKPTRFSRGKHAYPGITNRQDKKVAFVTLKEGDKIPVFEEVKEDKADEKANSKAETKAEAKADKKAEKAAKKEEKKAAKEAKVEKAAEADKKEEDK